MMYQYFRRVFFRMGIICVQFLFIVTGVMVSPVMSLELEFERTSSTDLIDNASDSHAQINTLRKQDPIDMDTIESLYINDIQILAQEVDTDNGLTLDADIIQAIADMRNGIDTSLTAQVLDKTIRRVFHLAALGRVAEVKDEFNGKSTTDLNMMWDEAFAAFNSVTMRGTVGQNVRMLSDDGLLIVDGGNPDLDDDVERAFINGQDAINKDSGDSDAGVGDSDLTRIKVQRHIIRFTMERGFYLIVLKELKGALEKRDSDPDGARKSQKEGEVFHTAIAAKVNRDNPTGNDIIEAQLTGPLSGIVADTIIREYSKAWRNGTIRELDGNSGAMNDGDFQKAVETAYEGILFASMMIDDLEQRLGKDDRDMVTKAFGDLILASAKGAKDEALTLREIIRNILDEYGAVL